MLNSNAKLTGFLFHHNELKALKSILALLVPDACLFEFCLSSQSDKLFEDSDPISQKVEHPPQGTGALYQQEK